MLTGFVGLIIIVLVLLLTSQIESRKLAEKKHHKEKLLLDRLRSDSELNRGYDHARKTFNHMEYMLRRSYYNDFKNSQINEKHPKHFFMEYNNIDISIEGGGFIKPNTLLKISLYPNKSHIKANVLVENTRSGAKEKDFFNIYKEDFNEINYTKNANEIMNIMEVLLDKCS